VPRAPILRFDGRCNYLDATLSNLKTQHTRARARARMNVHRKRITINDEASARFHGSFAKLRFAVEPDRVSTILERILKKKDDKS
jgi:hypothetical protein